MEHFLIGKTLSVHSDISNRKILKKCKRKRLFEPVSKDELENAYTQFLFGLSQEFARAPIRLSRGVIEGDYIRLTKICGKYFRIMGFSTDGSSYLHPEEALFLTECNKLQITYENLPLSIQQLYDQLLNNETYLHYIVYCRLSRLNFSLRKREIFYSFPIYHNPTERLFKIPKSISIPLGTQPVFDIEVINKTKIKDFQPLINTNKIHSLASLMNSLQKIVMVTNADSIGSKGDLNLVYDMYGNNHTEKERINNFSKRFPAHPDYVISIASPEQVCPDVEAQKLINVGLEPNTSIILCMVDGCDVSFYTMNHFEIPNLSFEITHHSNTQSL